MAGEGGRGVNKHSQLTLSTCIVSDGIKRFELLDGPEIIHSFSRVSDFSFLFFLKSVTSPEFFGRFFFR